MLVASFDRSQMPPLKPYTGVLRFTCAGRAVAVSRWDGGWFVETAGAMGRERVVGEVLRALEPSLSPQMLVTFDGEAGLVGRLRDGGGPRASYVVDYDAPNEHWGATCDTIESALDALLEQLESEDPPDSAW